MVKQRADSLLVEQGLAESRTIAQRLVMAGQVRADGELVAKPSSRLAHDAALEVIELPRYVSRGGYKLEAALKAFDLDVSGWICADLGASTGGFSDCLLQHNAEKVYAIDVGRGQLHWKLRRNPRVVIMEGTNARHLRSLPEEVNFVAIDASFISLKLLLPVVRTWLKEDGQLVVLVKPQFEAGRRDAAKGKGVIRDAETHRQVLLDVLGFAQEQLYNIKALIPSPLHGPKGNREFLAHLVLNRASIANLQNLINSALFATAKNAEL